MKPLQVLKILYVVVLAFLFTSVPAADSGLRLAVDLVDGSRVIGTPQNDSLRLRTDFAELKIPLERIDSVKWKPDRENVVIRLRNTDVLSGGIVPEPIQLRTLFGSATISMQHVQSLATIPGGVAAGPLPQDNLLVYFPFDEMPKDSLVTNAAQNKHAGKLFGAAWVEDGREGGAMLFSQGNDRIEVPDDPELHLQQLTLCAWVFPQDEQNSTWRGIIAKTSPGNWTGGFGLARYPSEPDVHFFVNYYSGETAHKRIPNYQWSHVAATYNGKQMVLYVDGARVSEIAPSYYGGEIKHSSDPLIIGAAPSGYHWIGKIDEVMVFGRVLSDREIERIYQRSR